MQTVFLRTSIFFLSDVQKETRKATKENLVTLSTNIAPLGGEGGGVVEKARPWLRFHVGLLMGCNDVIVLSTI